MDSLAGKILAIIGTTKMNVAGTPVLENPTKIPTTEPINRTVKLSSIFFDKLNKFNKYLLQINWDFFISHELGVRSHNK